MLRTFLLIITILVSSVAFAKQPTGEQLDKFFALKGAPECYESAMSSIYVPITALLEEGNFKVKNKDKTNRIADKITSEFTWENIKPALYKFYKSNYTYQEIEAYIKLLSRPEYRVMMSKEAALRPEYDKVLQSVTLQNMLKVIFQIQLEKSLSK